MWHVCIGTEVTQAQRDVEELIRHERKDEDRMKTAVSSLSHRSLFLGGIKTQHCSFCPLCPCLIFPLISSIRSCGVQRAGCVNSRLGRLRSAEYRTSSHC